MSDNKTIPSQDSVTDFIHTISDEKRRHDSLGLVKIMQAATGEAPVMWGPSIVGFGAHHYVYESGREGDTVAVGLSPRKQALVIYGIMNSVGNQKLLKDLGNFTAGKGCIYIKDLAAIDQQVLVTMIKSAFAARHNA
jgi:hypothetical protein